MKFFDKAQISGTRITNDGYLVADVKVARTGIQIYKGIELGKPELDEVRVYRPQEEVFHSDAMKSYAFRPLTVDHPDAPVTSENWKDFAVGQTGGEVLRDGQFVRIPLVLMDASAIKEVQNGKKEISMGYDAQIVFSDGVTPDGEKYDAIQKDLRMNHLAFVAKARGGSQLRLGDNNMKGYDMATATKTIFIDGLPIETTDAGAVVIEKLQGEIKASSKKFADAEIETAKTIAAKDAEIDALKAKVITDAEIEKRVSERTDLLTKAKAIAPKIVTDGKSADEIRKLAVVAAIGEDAIKDKSQHYIDARFDILVESKTVDPLKKALGNSANVVDASVDESDKAYAENVEYLRNAHKAKE